MILKQRWHYSQSGTYGAGGGGGTPITTIDGNVGSATGSTITIETANTNVIFAASGSTVLQDFGADTTYHNLYIGVTGTDNFGGNQQNTTLGINCFNTTATGSVQNTAMGYGALANTVSSNYSLAIGVDALNADTQGGNNVAIGNNALKVYNAPVQNQGGNVALGVDAGYQLVTGLANTLIGTSAGYNYTGAESNNIIIGSGNSGVLGDNNTLRIGDPGVIASCYITGISGVNVGSTAQVVTMGTGGTANQLGTAVITAGSGITVSSGANTITISASGTTNLAYTNVNHAASPYTVLSTDEYISVDCSGGAVTLLFPNAATSGRTYVVKDRTGSAGTNNITIESVSGSVNIDGATTFVMNTNYESISLMGNATSYEVW